MYPSGAPTWDTSRCHNGAFKQRTVETVILTPPAVTLHSLRIGYETLHVGACNPFTHNIKTYEQLGLYEGISWNSAGRNSDTNHNESDCTFSSNHLWSRSNQLFIFVHNKKCRRITRPFHIPFDTPQQRERSAKKPINSFYSTRNIPEAISFKYTYLTRWI